MGVSRGDFNPPHRVAGPSAAPPHAAAYLAAQPDPKPHPRPVKPEGDGLSRAPLPEELVALIHAPSRCGWAASRPRAASAEQRPHHPKKPVILHRPF